MKSTLSAETEADETAKVPGDVNMCVLKLPQVIVAFPPVAE